MKIRSRALYTYLFENGVLNGTPEDIDRAKCDYRKRYKRNWKQRSRPRKEVRIEFTLKQYASVKIKARQFELTPTAYGRNTMLATAGIQPLIYRKDDLLKILQLLSMTVIAAKKDNFSMQLSEQLEQVEKLLFHYLMQ